MLRVVTCLMRARLFRGYTVFHQLLLFMLATRPPRSFSSLMLFFVAPFLAQSGARGQKEIPLTRQTRSVLRQVSGLVAWDYLMYPVVDQRRFLLTVNKNVLNCSWSTAKELLANILVLARFLSRICIYHAISSASSSCNLIIPWHFWLLM